VITKDMIIRDVARQYPQTISVFGNWKVDFCCGGSHSIEQTATACRVTDIDGLIAALNEAIKLTDSK